MQDLPRKYLDAVGIITLLVLLPMALGTLYGYASGSLTFSEYTGVWKGPMLLLLGFWLRGAAQDRIL